jgi:hypothetical protein
MTFQDGIKASNSGPWLPARLAAEYTGLSIWTLKRMRAAGEGPNWSRVRRRAIYDMHELNRWMASQSTRQRQSASRPMLQHQSSVLA